MNIIVCGDPHITEDSIEELNGIFNEVFELGNNKTTLVITGDLYDNKRPSPEEVYFGTRMLSRAKHFFRSVILLTGNHAHLSNKFSNVDYLKYLGITICDDYLFPLENIYFGHFMTNNSQTLYGALDRYEKNRPLSELKKYKLTILGHQHAFQKLADNVYHLGSARWVSYGEVLDEAKYIMKIVDDKYDFLELTSAIPIKEIFTISDVDRLPLRTKVLLTYKTFEQYKKEISAISQVKYKYHKFRVKLDFVNVPDKVEVIDNDKNVIKDWLENIKDKDIQKLLKEQFDENKENYLI